MRPPHGAYRLCTPSSRAQRSDPGQRDVIERGATLARFAPLAKTVRRLRSAERRSPVQAARRRATPASLATAPTGAGTPVARTIPSAPPARPRAVRDRGSARARTAPAGSGPPRAPGRSRSARSRARRRPAARRRGRGIPPGREPPASSPSRAPGPGLPDRRRAGRAAAPGGRARPRRATAAGCRRAVPPGSPRRRGRGPAGGPRRRSEVLARRLPGKHASSRRSRAGTSWRCSARISIMAVPSPGRRAGEAIVCDREPDALGRRGGGRQRPAGSPSPSSRAKRRDPGQRNVRRRPASLDRSAPLARTEEPASLSRNPS